MTKDVEIDVAITAFRRWDLTDSCLAHLARQSIEHRVVVCDNGCDEGTAQRIGEKYPNVTVVQLPRNMPYPVACNTAVAAGNAEFVVMMNNDVDVRSDFLAQLLAVLRSDPDIGSVGCLLLRPGERSIDSAGLVADSTLAGFPRFQGSPPPAPEHRGPLLTGPAGAAAAFRRIAWEQMSGLDEALPAYMEDLDLALRLRSAGWKTAFADQAVGVHIGSATFGKGSAEQRHRSGYGRGYMLRRYGVLRSRRAFRAAFTEIVVVIGDLIISRDLAALRGRIAGWQGAAGLARRASPPTDALDRSISTLGSLQLRVRSYGPAK